MHKKFSFANGIVIFVIKNPILAYITIIVLFAGWKKSLTEWMEFLADNLHESNDALQECFVQVSR